MLVYDGVVALDALGPHEVFAAARDADGEPLYDVVLTAGVAGAERAESGVVFEVERPIDELDPHTLVVPGSAMHPPAPCLHEDVLATVERAATRASRIVGICTGAFPLGAVGRLDGRRATTHWSRAADLARAYPRVNVEPDAIFVNDGPVWTSAGVTAGIDLALALVEADHGREVALAVARELVVFLRRPGGQSQFSRYLTAPPSTDDRIDRVLRWLPDHLHEPLSIEDLASRAGMSPRNFRRVFHRVLGQSPARFLERCRVDAVAGALEDSDETLASLAHRFGFGGTEALRRAFRRCIGVTPRDYRARFR
ncbi:MAG: helix-turn-helix domain-containing protein [Myxococcota bacterium]